MSAKDIATSNFIRPCLDCGTTVHVTNGRAEPHDCDPPTSGAELVARAWWNGWAAKASEGVVEGSTSSKDTLVDGSTVRPVVVSGASSAPDLAAIEADLAVPRPSLIEMFDWHSGEPVPGAAKWRAAQRRLPTYVRPLLAALAAERQRADEAEARLRREKSLCAEANDAVRHYAQRASEVEAERDAARAEVGKLQKHIAGIVAADFAGADDPEADR